VVEQLDFKTRKIIEGKDKKISELQSQVEDYRKTMDRLSMRMEELERKKVANDNQGPPMLTGEDVDMGRQPNTNDQLLSQLLCLDKMPEAFAGDINMHEQVTNNTQAQSIFRPLNEDEEDFQKNYTGRPNKVRGKQAKRTLDEDEEDFGLDEVDGSDLDEDEEDFEQEGDMGDSSRPSVPRQGFDWGGDMGDGSRSSVPRQDFNRDGDMGDSSQPSVPRPIFDFNRPRGGAGPRLRMDPQTSTATNPVPNIPNLPTSTLQLAGITSEQVAAIANIVMAVQNQNPPKHIPLQSRKTNVSGTIKEKKSRLEKTPRKRALVVRARFAS
jgi:hypothetical protein